MTNEQYSINRTAFILLIAVFIAVYLVAKTLTNILKSAVSSLSESEHSLIMPLSPAEDPEGLVINPLNIRKEITRCLRKRIRCLFTMPCYLRDYESCGIDEHT